MFSKVSGHKSCDFTSHAHRLDHVHLNTFKLAPVSSSGSRDVGTDDSAAAPSHPRQVES